MAGRASAVAAARMFEVNVIAEQDIENRAGLPVMMERRLGRIEFDNPLGVTVFENHANPGHLLLSGSVFGRQCERSLGYLPIRLIFAIMVTPPTKVSAGG
jgi:hypothetical protein